MRLVTYSHANYPLFSRTGLLMGSKVVDLNLGYAALLGGSSRSSYSLADSVVPSQMLDLIRRGEEGLNDVKEVLEAAASTAGMKGPNGERVIFDLAEVKLHAPLRCPIGIRDFLSFEAHMKNTYTKLGREIPKMWFEIPSYYRANPMNVIGPEEEISCPSFTDMLDYEFEVAAYIFKEGKNVAATEAEHYIFGFSIFNDVSARDRQRSQMGVGLGPGKGKDFDRGKVLGPCIVTRDEVDFGKVKCSVRINGEKVSEGSTADMYWSWGDIIEFVSQDETIYPGEVLGSGTIGNGSGLEIGRSLRSGDTIELEADQLGVLRNRVSERGPLRLWRGKY